MQQLKFYQTLTS